LVCCRARILFARALRQSHGLHVTGGVAVDSLAEKKVDRARCAFGNYSVRWPRAWYRFGGRLVGKLSSRHADARCPRAARASADRESGCLVLPRQAILA